MINCIHTFNGNDLFIFHSLLDILAGRKDKRFLTGDVLINGERQPNNFKLVSGYVVQVSCVYLAYFMPLCEDV